MVRVIAGLCLVAAPALAQPPRYDDEARCDEVAGFGDTYSDEMFNFCIEAEQSAYDALKEQWDTVSSSIREHCDQVATFGTAGSYEMLEFCVDEETSAASDRGTFKY